MNDLSGQSGSAGDAIPAAATPVMAQFLKVKAAHPDCLLFYRMGDFYELFFRDAEIAAAALGIALTKRGKHLGEDIPMCGVPVHAADGYLQRLIRQGHRVAVCEQLEDPAEARRRGSKAVVRRDVVRLVTPGTLTEDSLLESKSSNHLAALARLRATGEMALAWADISSGSFACLSTSEARLAADIARLNPSEIVVPDSLLDGGDIGRMLGACRAAVTPVPASRFDSSAGERRLKDHFNIATLQAFGSFTRAETAALGGLLDYIQLTQVGQLPHLRPPQREEQGAVLLIDAATRSNLELTRTLAGDKHGSLLSVIDMTVTPAGARLLAERLASPLTDVPAITARLNEVSFFLSQKSLRQDVRGLLSRMPDLDRALGRICLARGGPRDLAAIRDSLDVAERLKQRIDGAIDLGGLPIVLSSSLDALATAEASLQRKLDDALAENLPLLVRDGSFVKQDFDADLDQNRKLRDETRSVIAGLQSTYAESTGVKALKIRHNNVLGYFIEVPAQHAAPLQAAEQAGTFIHRQSMAGAARFTTTELSGLESRISAAADRALAIEMEIYNRLSEEVRHQRDALSTVAAAVASIDLGVSLAELAEKRRYARPRVDQSMAFEVKAGRHPVVEAMLEEEAGQAFVANDCELADGGRRLWLVTGPNMAGKSTFLRQNALIVILAQMGSFVPAAEARIGIVDRLFSRVGAADDLARGRSTFMVEMVETAAILNQAGARSFVVLDEIGRGTATFDGLSIAWAVVETLHEVNRCRALFATHYHELTALAETLSHLANATVKVKEWQNEVIFLHEVGPGVADRSYGIHVARLAGLPPPVIARAGAILSRLEQNEGSRSRKAMVDDLPLFSASVPAPAPMTASPVEERLNRISPDELTPRDALGLVYELKSLLRGEP